MLRMLLFTLPAMARLQQAALLAGLTLTGEITLEIQKES